jgi:micrococcal nuclease
LNLPDYRYYYSARIINVVDGDTIDAEVDLGLRIFAKVRFRLYGIDTPELRDIDPATREKAQKAKQYLIDKVLDKEVILHTYMDRGDKYGRWLCTVLYEDKSLNDELIAEGLAVTY